MSAPSDTHEPASPQATRSEAAATPSSSTKHIWLITGPAGAGKSTVGKHLATSLGLPYVEGDEFHPPANVAKMAAGHALTDADRWDWLQLLRSQALVAVAPLHVTSVILTCSALKRAYRDVLRGASGEGSSQEAGLEVQVHFMYLRASEELLLERVQARKGHYMKAGMVESQYEVLEEPGPEEADDCVTVDVGRNKEVVLEAALDVVRSPFKKEGK